MRNADKMQIYKYVVHQVANAYGKTATFMPKPVYGDNGSGMQVHQSIWKDGKPTFAGDEYAGLSKAASIISAVSSSTPRQSNAFTNPTTNSYKRLVPGYEAPCCWLIPPRNRSAFLPYSVRHGSEVQACGSSLPDPAQNPYSALLPC